MLNSRFEELWLLLTERFVRYHTFPRSSANVVELARVRAELDEVRAAIAEEREHIDTHRPRALNRQDVHGRRETAAGVPVRLIDADAEQVTKVTLQLATASN